MTLVILNTAYAGVRLYGYQGVCFVPQSDQLIDGQIAQEGGGDAVTGDGCDEPGIRKRIASSIGRDRYSGIRMTPFSFTSGHA
jgi:hypothetical protein